MTVYYCRDYDEKLGSRYYVDIVLASLQITASLDHNLAGKPFIVGRDNLHISISHSGRTIVIIIADSGVGIDVEVIRERKSYRRVAQRMLGGDVLDIMEFYRKWTAYEAMYKLGNANCHLIIEDYIDGCMIAVASSEEITNLEYKHL